MNADQIAEFEEFVRARSRPLLRTAHLLTGDLGHAEDILQQSYERLARRWSGLSGDPEAYVRRTLVNLSTDRWRSRARRVRERSGEVPEVPAARDATVDVEVRLDLLAALAQLGVRQRAVLVLRFFNDLSEDQVAAAVGCSVGTVKSTTHRALARLRILHDHDSTSSQPARSGR